MTAVLILGLFPAFMAFAAVMDLLTMTIPNRLTLGMAVVFVVVALAVGLPWQAMAWHAGAGALMLAITFGLFAMGWIGGGDAKFAAATVLWLGPMPSLTFALYGSLYGGLLTLLLLGFRALPLPPQAAGVAWIDRLHDRKSGVPYGIALAAGGLTAWPGSPLWTIGFGG